MDGSRMLGAAVLAATVCAAGAPGQECEPELVGAYDPQWSLWDVCVRGDLAYVTTDELGLVVADISDPALAQPLGVR
jgi:hypothetical protein